METARHRIALLLDKGSFEEYDKSVHDGESVITGRGTIDGRAVYVYSHVFKVCGGSISEAVSTKICKVADMAITEGAPFICLNESGGARIQDGLGGLAGLGEIFTRQISASGVIPQISGVFGPCAGGAVYSPALSDFIIMIEDTSYMFLTGPGVVKKVTGEDVVHEVLGGASVHASKSGVAQFVAESEAEGINIMKKLLSFLPSDNRRKPPFRPTEDPADRLCKRFHEIVPENPAKAYDMHEVIGCLVDDGEFLETHSKWARNIITCFGHMGGHSVGIVANQPAMLAGALDINAARKAARFIRFCDAFNIPIISLIDVPGYLCGTQQEHNGAIIHGAKLLFAYGEATVPKIGITLRKSYGGAHIAMSCKQMRSDVNFAWPGASFAVMGPEGAGEILHSKKLQQQYEDTSGSPYAAAEKGYIDEVIEPEETRIRIIKALEDLVEKKTDRPWKKHDNMPL